VNAHHFSDTVKDGYSLHTATDSQSVDLVSWTTNQTFYDYKVGFAVNVSHDGSPNVRWHDDVTMWE
jgi:hypothetical protein